MTSSLSRNGIAVAILAALVVSCSKAKPPPSSESTQHPRPIQVVAAKLVTMERALTVAGSLIAYEHATLSVKVAGRLQLIHVDIGTSVAQGDVIAQVEPRDYELRLQQAAAALAQARAAAGLPLEGEDDRFDPEGTSSVKLAKAVLAEATQNRERVLSLGKAGIAPKAELDTVEAAYGVASSRYEAALEEARSRQAILAQRRAEFELAQKQLADTVVRAPFGGAIQARIANVGEFLPAGSSVVSMVKTDPLRLRLEVPERSATAVRLRQQVRLQLEGETNLFLGVIARISPALSEQNRMLIVEADVPNHGTLRPGLFAQAKIIIDDKSEGLAVPANALITFAGLEKVVVVRNGKAREQMVSTGRRGSDWVEILSGLQVGEAVVVSPGNLRTGQAVSIIETPTVQTTQAWHDSGP